MSTQQLKWVRAVWQKIWVWVWWPVENLRFWPLQPLGRIKISKKWKILISDHRESQTISNICHRAKKIHPISNIDRRPTAFKSLRLRQISKGCRILLILQEHQTTSNATMETSSNHMNTDGRLTALARLSFRQHQPLINRFTISKNERCCYFTENHKPLSRMPHVVSFCVFQMSMEVQQDAQLGNWSTLFQSLVGQVAEICHVSSFVVDCAAKPQKLTRSCNLGLCSRLTSTLDFDQKWYPSALNWNWFKDFKWFYARSDRPSTISEVRQHLRKLLKSY